MANYVGAIDQGTTSTRFMIFDHSGNEVARHQLEHEQILPQAGWVEHDPVEIWERTSDVIKTGLDKAGLQASDLVALGITNQRETAVVWDKKTGQPYYNAIVWQDTRTDRIASKLERDGHAETIRQKGRPAPRPGRYFLRRQDPVESSRTSTRREAAEAGDAIFGYTRQLAAVEPHRGTDGGVHVTDPTNASRPC
jgi:glycerol kinase